MSLRARHHHGRWFSSHLCAPNLALRMAVRRSSAGIKRRGKPLFSLDDSTTSSSRGQTRRLARGLASPDEAISLPPNFFQNTTGESTEFGEVARHRWATS